MIVLDTTALSLLFVPTARANTKDGRPIKYAKERMQHLVEVVSQQDGQIIIPTPCLAEMFVKLDQLKIDEFLKRIKTSPWFRVESFDAAAAGTWHEDCKSDSGSGQKRRASSGPHQD